MKIIKVMPLLVLSIFSQGVMAAKEGIYIGAGFGHVEYDREHLYGGDSNGEVSEDETSPLLELNMGYRPSQYWAFNVDLGIASVHDRVSYEDLSSKGTYLNELNIRPELHLIWPTTDGIDIYGTIGANIGLLEVERHVENQYHSSRTTTQRTWSVRPAYGIGIQWLYSDNWTLKGELTRYDVDFVGDDETYNTTQTAFTIGVVYNFDFDD